MALGSSDVRCEAEPMAVQCQAAASRLAQDQSSEKQLRSGLRPLDRHVLIIQEQILVAMQSPTCVNQVLPGAVCPYCRLQTRRMPYATRLLLFFSLFNLLNLLNDF